MTQTSSKDQAASGRGARLQMQAADGLRGRRLLLIGGGRWARVIASVLIEKAPPELAIDIYSASNAQAMREWIPAHEARPIRVVDELADLLRAPLPCAAIIANAAKDHARVATACLAAGIPTLVEKPLATSGDAATELVDLARRSHVYLAVSRVFQFARYLDRFVAEVECRGPIHAARVFWSDPDQETRYGESKRTDPSVPIVTDILPHVLPILRRLRDVAPSVIDADSDDPGRRAELRFDLAGAEAFVRLERGATRRRRIEIDTEQGEVTLDFSSEPGRICVAGQTDLDGDPGWQVELRPMARMLDAFLIGALGGTTDPRLSPISAVEECRLTDRVHELRASRRPSQA